MYRQALHTLRRWCSRTDGTRHAVGRDAGDSMAPSTSKQTRAPKHALRPAMPHAGWRRGLATLAAVAMTLTGVSSATAQDSPSDALSDAGVTVISDGQVVTDPDVIAATLDDDAIMDRIRQIKETNDGADGQTQSDDSANASDADGQKAEAEQTADADTGSAQADADAAPAAATETLGGRDFEGQVTKTINGKTYILIGNEQQLRAIGSGKKVTGRVWQVEQHRATLLSEWKDAGDASVAYVGDADLDGQGTLADKAYSNPAIKLLTRTYYFAYDAAGNRVDVTDATYGGSAGLTYTGSENYIVFRDIDLSKNAANTGDTSWSPLMFSGTMLGATSPAATTAGSLWGTLGTDGASVNDTAGKPVVSHVNVHQTGVINVNNQQGVGFFATITNKSNIGKGLNASQGLVSTGTVTVANLKLSDVTVANDATEVGTDFSLVGELLELVTGLLKLVGLDLNSLVNSMKKDPSNFATGAFVGRLYGDAKVVGCEVEDATVSNVKGMTGGFVGHMEGVTRYDVLSNLSSALLKALADLLNLLPFLGLGDLITFLEGVLGTDNLIPVGFYTPVVSDSRVSGLKAGTVIGNDSSDYAGGFVGSQIGAIVENSSLTSQEVFTVKARKYAGGFAGVSRNGEIGGPLQSLGITLLSALRPQAAIAGSTLRADGGMTVAAQTYAGGFIGRMANAYAVNDSLDSAAGTVSVNATSAYAGGFTGRASVGWGLEAGTDTDEQRSDHTLISNLVETLEKLLEANPDAGGALLTVAGVDPSIILGAQLNAAAMDVTATAGYAGGIVGQGSGTVIGDSSQERVGALSFWKANVLAYPTPRSTVLNGLRSVKVTRTDNMAGSYAGGVAGDLQPTTVAGLLNNVLGIGDINTKEGRDFLKKYFSDFATFTVENLTLTGVGDGLTVSADDFYAGGVLGCGTGGDVTNVKVTNLANVSAKGASGGFIGFSGPADIVGSNGINLLGLVKISGLLSVAQNSSVEVRSSTVAGSASGLTVAATGTDKSDAVVAGGFYGQANSTKTRESHVTGLKAVTADKAVSGSSTGGYVGRSTTGGLMDAISDSEGSTVLDSDLLNISDLLGAVPYLIPKYWDTTVTYVNGGYVEGDIAGGFAGDLQSGKVNYIGDDDIKDDSTLQAVKDTVAARKSAVINIDHVTGGTYAGGFGGRVVSGALATAGKGGVSVLGKLGTLDLGNLLTVASAYVPFVAYSGILTNADTFEQIGGGTRDANADYGLTVEARNVTDDLNSGAAGGFVGYASGAQISESAVTQLRHTTVTPPANLEVTHADSYYGDQSHYAVDGGRYAGGYAGKMDVGSAASVGGTLNLLGDTISETQISQLLGVVDVVVSTIDHSDVTAGAGGYAVRANADGGASGMLGMAGGYVGSIKGGHIQSSNAHEFAYVIGRVSAGGYVGTMEPGAAVDVLGKGSFLQKILNINIDNALSLVQAFVPTIRNSSTDAVICGAAVRAEADSSDSTRRGMAGGYVGHNRGGHVWGKDSRDWSSITGTAVTDADRHEAYAARIRSVYGNELAGGYTGFMEAADTADTGTISVLGGLVSLGSLVNVLGLVYPTEEHTRVTGPLRNMAYSQWQTWRDNVGKYSAYGQEFTDIVTAGGAKDVTDQATLDTFLGNYIFGFNVVAGRAAHVSEANQRDSGVAGGHVGIMRTGTITDGQSQDVKKVTAMRAAGGYAGTMETGSAATFGSASLFGLDLDLGSLVSTPQVFVPVIKSSSVAGYRKGLTVEATGTDITHGTGYAGGYVALAVGAQIWGDRDANGEALAENAAASDAAGANVSNLRRVKGRNSVGGYVGLATSGSVADVDTNASDGFLQKLLNKIVTSMSPTDLVNVLQATVTTIRGAHVSADSADWGYTVEGAYADGTGNTLYALNAGGFAGSLQAAILGDRDSAKGTGTEADTANDPAALTVTGLRGVDGGQYAGGFVGLADTSSVASVAGGTAGTGTDGTFGDSSTSVLFGLLKAGNVGVLEAFRTFIYDAHVAGVADGIQVKAHVSTTSGMLDSTRFTGAAGGFGGGLINGSVKKSGVTNLNSVRGLNYVGGFIGHLGKSGTVAADNAQLEGLLGVTAGVLDIWGSHVSDSTVDGIKAGYTVTATHDGVDYGLGSSKPRGREVAGGFTGYADLARVKGSAATGLKKVTSGEIAGGFVGETTRAYLVDLQANSLLLDLLLHVVDALVKALYVPQAERSDLIDLGTWLPLVGKVLNIKVLSDGDLLYVNLFGLKVSVALSKADSDNQQQSDVAIVTIGDSVIKLPCSKDGIDMDGARENLHVQLIKGNRTHVENSTATGTRSGYDVFGGFAAQDKDGTDGLATGYAGGFAGLNDEGVLANDHMVYADTIRGTSGLVDPFSNTKLDSAWSFNSMSGIVGPVDDGNGGKAYNTYRVYRRADAAAGEASVSAKDGGTEFSTKSSDTGEGTADTGLDRWEVRLFDVVNTYDSGVTNQSGAAGDADTKWVGIKDATVAIAGSGDGSGDAGTASAKPLDAYVSAAKAVLMLDTAVADNNGGLTPEPDDGQDPCGLNGCQTVDLTVQKVWRNGNLPIPDSIVLEVTASYTDGDETVTPKTITCYADDCTTKERENPQTVEMSAKANGTTWNDTWRTVLTGLPVAFVDKGAGANGEDVTRYYTYTVKETKLIYGEESKSPSEAGYTVTVGYGKDGDGKYVATVTNISPLPNTGGMGTLWFVILGVLLTLLGAAWYLRNNRARAGAVATGPVAAGGAAPGGAGIGFLSRNLGKRLSSVVLSGGRASSPVVLSGGRSPKPKDLPGKRGRHA